MNKFTYKNEQTGRSMIEMLGVLAIVGVLSVGGIAGYSKAMAKFKIGKTQDQIMTMVNNIRSLYGTESSYLSLSDDTLIDAGLAPKDMISADDLLVGAFGGQVNVAPAGATTTNPEGFVIELTELPSEVCLSIASSDWGSAANGLDAITITAGGTTVTDGTFATTPSTDTGASATGLTALWDGTSEALPVKISSATTACANATQNSVAIYFR